MSVFKNKYTLDRFKAYSSDLTDRHRRLIDSITSSIENSFEGGGPRLSMIKIEGHAAFYDKNPNPKIPYIQQGRNRANKVLNALHERLKVRGLERLVEIWSVHSAGVEDPVTHNRTQSSRARNRRVEVEISQIDTKLAPWRWICRLEIDFGQDVCSIYKPLGPSAQKGIGSGVLISERHILTSAHNVAALRKNKNSLSYTWVQPKKIRVSPGWISSGQIPRTPFGTRLANPVKTRLFSGFDNRYDSGDYNWDGTMKHKANFSKSAKDLAIVEVKKSFSRRPLWWGHTDQFPLGIPNFSILTEIAKERDNFIRTAGFGESYDQLVFSKGVFRQHQKAGLIVDDDVSTSRGHSGGPHWARDSSGKTRLIAIHMGDNDVGGDVAVALTPKKKKWINSII